MCLQISSVLMYCSEGSFATYWLQLGWLGGEGDWKAPDALVSKVSGKTPMKLYPGMFLM